MQTPKRLQGQTPSHARSKVQEKGLATRIGGSVVKGSGSGDERGDVRLRKIIRIEAKTTAAKSFQLTVDIVRKLESAIVGTGEIPVIQVELMGGAHRLLVMPDYAMELLLDAARDRQG
jgi:hypothetical protein